MLKSGGRRNVNHNVWDGLSLHAVVGEGMRPCDWEPSASHRVRLPSDTNLYFHGNVTNRDYSRVL